MARQVWVAYAGPPEVLVSKEFEPALLDADSVRIECHAVGVCFADVLVRMGRYPQSPPTPCVPGFEVSGIVQAVGKQTKRFKVGDRVVAICRFGGYASVIDAPENLVFALPQDVDFVTAATLPVNYLTALLLTKRTCSVREKDTVVIHSAAGGVGLALVDFCYRLNTRIVAVASREKHAFLYDRGAAICLDSQSPDLFSLLTEALGSRKADVVFDSQGGRSWKESLNLLAPFGRLGVFGFSALVQSEGQSFSTHSRKLGDATWFGFDAYELVSEAKSVGGFNLATLWHGSEFLSQLPEMMEHLFVELKNGGIRPWVGKTFPLDQAEAAHRFLQSRKCLGKIVLTP